MFCYEYNKQIRFDGDIIITDPCYIINKENKDDEKCPAQWDFLSRFHVRDDGGRCLPEPEDYPDARPKTFDDFLMEARGNSKLAKAEQRLDSCFGEVVPMISDTLQKELAEYNKAVLEYLSKPHDDWDRCNRGEKMENLGLSTFIVTYTLYGDWRCTTFNLGTKEAIGEFCADSGQVGVFLLEEVLKYNPKFDYHLKRIWTTTLIKDFHGFVQIKDTNRDVSVVGNGNIDFKTAQTGF